MGHKGPLPEWPAQPLCTQRVTCQRPCVQTPGDEGPAPDPWPRCLPAGPGRPSLGQLD